jgi:inorganic pyrophosphatase
MGWFGKKLRKVVEEVKKTEELWEKIQNIDKFPGNLTEYIQFKGENYEIIDTGNAEKFVGNGNESALKGIIGKGCEAVIHYHIDPSQYVWYGLPVKRK